MCGIIGLIGSLPGPGAAERVARAVRMLRHRGPDGEGLFVQAPGSRRATIVLPECDRQLPDVRQQTSDACGIALGHRRLAIIDLTRAGAQPMASADGRYVLVFNGEIYNYVELRQELRESGTQFRSDSDTEVLLAGYERWGSSVLDRAVGMFAFALLDREDQSLVLARDCFGMKPLYYAASDRGLGFASELRALLALLDLRPRADGDGLADYLVHGLTDHRVGTMFADVRSVPAASYVRVSLRGPRVAAPVRYWAPVVDRVDDRPPAVLARELRHRFLDSVRLHMRSDVRVGTLLSGGIDSSAIVGAMREVGGASLEIRTFSFIPDAGAVSEERWIDEVNASVGAIPHKVRITRDAWEMEAGPLAERQGEPFGSLAIHAQSALFRTAADEGLRVLLDGQGADELLAGYAHFRGARMAGHLRRREYARARRLARGLRGEGGASLRRAMSPYLDGARLLLPAWATTAARRAGVQPAVVDETWLRTRGLRPRDVWRPSSQRPLHERLRDAIEITSLPGLLRYADRSAMMHGVESRLPFLTRGLVEFALALPDSLLVSDDGLGKAIFRNAMRGLVPDSVLDRREKIGFAVPLRDWLLGSRYASRMAAAAATLPCVNTRRVAPWLADLAAGRAPGPARTFLLWRLIGLAQWTECYDVAIA